ncbi:hypothetical protein VSS37_08300 [Candidatus Thiothrix sp. Deng01]|uniref:YbhB/YbcL family Raf kinase inhibitor-like protein n=1 Tax=Candidatus Thiothrix phosphatis TaxID=3112415 RepID=A0ABU6CXY1_9GAMM|nr:hypothetical protein [Candidatus Thiothrix sp. Deng01]MEB4590974.1 hypothetical protein [Candidatus Thiothrix sp. Deng01]
MNIKAKREQKSIYINRKCLIYMRSIYHLESPTAGTTSLPDGWIAPASISVGVNDFGSTTYGGPCPPSQHTYEFKLYALDLDVGVLTFGGVPATKSTLLSAINGHVLGETTLRGVYGPREVEFLPL